MSCRGLFQPKQTSSRACPLASMFDVQAKRGEICLQGWSKGSALRPSIFLCQFLAEPCLDQRDEGLQGFRRLGPLSGDMEL